MTPAPLPERRLVSREDFERVTNAHGPGMGHICSCVDRAEILFAEVLAERDAAIRVAVKWCEDAYPTKMINHRFGVEKEILDLVEKQNLRP